MLRPALLLAACVIALSPLHAGADDLLAIYDLAVQSDPTLREAEQNLYATREVKPQARALLLPDFSLTGNGRYQNVKTNQKTTFGTFKRNDTYASGTVGAVVNQSVYDRANWMRLSQSNNTIAQAEAEYRNSQIDLMVRVTEAYFGVLEASDAVRVNAALVAADERQLEQSKQRFEVGLVAITDVNDSQAAYDRSRANLITAENDLDNKWEALRRIIGPVSVPLARLGDRLPLAPPQPDDINVWAETALANNYAIIAAKEATEAARKEIKIERSGYLPTVDAQAGYDIARDGAEFYSDSDTGYVGLSLNVPLYQGGAVASRTRQAGIISARRRTVSTSSAATSSTR